MLPFDYTFSNPNIAIGPAVLYALLLIYLAWVFLGRRYGDEFDDIYLYFIVAIIGVVQASLLIAFGSSGYTMWKVAFVSYFVLTALTWIIGVRKCYKLVVNLSKDPKTLHACRNILNISYWISVGLLAITIAVAVFLQGTKYDVGFQGGLATGLSILVLVLLWLIVMSYFGALYYSFNMTTRIEKDTLLLFGILNGIVAVVDTVFMTTNFAFFGDVAAGFILFFLTDFLSVITLFIVTLAWKFNIYEKVQPYQTV